MSPAQPQVALIDIEDFTALQAEPCVTEPTVASAKLDSMRHTDAATIVISRKTLAWAGAALVALFSGGQVASLKLAEDGPDPATTELSRQVAHLSATVESLQQAAAERGARHDRILDAVLRYTVESDRYARQSHGDAKPWPTELEEASRRLRDAALP